MALRLGAKAKPQWREFPGGVRLKMRPATGLDEELARGAAVAAARAIVEAGDTLGRYGLDSLTTPDIIEGGNASELLGYGTTLFAAELAERVVTEWDGIVGDDDTPLELTLANLGMLMAERAEGGMKSYAALFVNAACTKTAAARDEGNVSASAPNGTGALAEPIAADAAKTTSPVQKA